MCHVILKFANRRLLVMTINDAYMYTCIHYIGIHYNNTHNISSKFVFSIILPFILLPIRHDMCFAPQFLVSQIFHCIQPCFDLLHHTTQIFFKTKSFLMMQKSLQSNEFENAYIHLTNTISGWLAPSERCIYTQSVHHSNKLKLSGSLCCMGVQL